MRVHQLWTKRPCAADIRYGLATETANSADAPVSVSKAISSIDRTLPISSRMTNLPATLPIPGDEVGADPRAERWRRFNFASRDVDDLRDRIDHDSDVLTGFRVVDFDDHDAGASREFAGLSAEARRKVDHRNDAAAQVDHPANEGRHHRNRREMGRTR